MSPADGTDVRASIDAVWRIESARLIAGLTRFTRDLTLAEDLAQDALVEALETWPTTGTPRRPGAWLMTVAKRRAVDQFRRNENLRHKYAELALELERADATGPDLDAAIDDPIGDDLLRLVFMTCHPVLSTDARSALTLKLVAGLTTEEIARAYLVAVPTVAQRIVRAKRKLATARIEFELPGDEDLSERLASVLEVVYLIFNEGYSATAGDEWMRPALCEDALRLGRILAGLAPGEPEVHGLVALMEIQASRIHARTDRDGEPILLLDQNRARWDRLLIARGLAALDRAAALTGPGTPAGSYQLQASIAACHARALRPEDTDWRRIADLYAELGALSSTPVVELNRAMAVSMADGPQAGLDLVDRLGSEPALASYHLLPSVRGDLLLRLDRRSEARAEFLRAAQLTRNERQRAQLLARARECEEATQAL